MDKKFIEDLCAAFDIDKLVLFFRKLSSKFTPSDEDFSEWGDENFNKICNLGRIKFSEVETLSLFSLKSTYGLAEKSSKKRQFDKAKKILKDCMEDAGIFVFYDESGNFRMSLIFQEYSGTKTEFSNYKRFTYYVSPSLTNKTFIKQMSLADFSSLESIKEAFSVEKVTKQFYDEIAGWYFRALKKIKFTKDILAEKNGKEKFVIRLITRLIFIWFMKEKKIIKPNLFDKDHIANILNTLEDDDSSYYNAILQNLFFATLNTPIEKRKFRYKVSGYKNASYMDHSVYRYENYFNNKDDIELLFKDIPFLNGGLFECLDRKGKDENDQNVEIRLDGFSDKDVGLKVPNWLFFYDETYSQRGILNILSQYNFTIDENETDDYEIALDPELLGRVFENLLARTNPETSETVRKTTGSYYTPRQIVDYMVENSITEYLKTRLDDTPELDDLLKELFDQSKDTFECMDENIKSKIIQSLAEIKIADPAVGSGAFPMGILNKLVFLINKLDPNDEMWSQIHLEHIENKNLPKSVKEKLMDDIQKRVKEKNYDYIKKLFLIQNSIYGVDIQDIAIQISKLRFFLSLLIEENIDSNRANMGIEPLPNLDFKLMAGNSLVEYLPQLNKNTFHDEKKKMIDDLEEKKEKYFVENDAKRKDKLKSEIFDLMKRIVLFENNVKIDEIEKQISSLKDNLKLFHGDDADFETQDIKKYKMRLDQLKKENEVVEFNSDSHFEWHIIFSEVFEDGGFDIIIGNPPYLNIEKLEDKLKNIIFSVYETCSGRTDIYIAFIEKSLSMLRKKGILSYIIPYAFTKQKYGEKLRKLLIDDFFIREILDVSEYYVFQNANVKNVVLSLLKTDDQNRHTIIKKASSMQDIEKNSLKSFSIPQKEFSKLKDCRFETIELSNILDIKDKILSQTIPLKEICFVAYGARLNHRTQKIGKKNYIKHNYKSGFKSYIEGKNIEQYYSSQDAWLNYQPKEHYNPMFRELFENPKLVTINVVKDRLRFAFDDKQMYNSHTVINCVKWNLLTKANHPSVRKNISEAFVKNGNNFDYKYLLAILNSKLMSWYFKYFLSEQIHFYPNDVKSMPIKNMEIKVQKIFVEKVNQILDLLKQNSLDIDSETQKTIKEIKKNIDYQVYKLYGVTEEEIEIIEKQLGF